MPSASMSSSLFKTAFRLCIVTGIAAVLACCANKRAAYQSALAAPTPPADFWLAVTVLKAPADTASRSAAMLRAPVGVRPARYVVEADRMLRVALGSGAADNVFPTQTRQLTEPEFDSLWNTIKSSSLGAVGNPAEVGHAPDAAAIGSRTVYVVSFCAAGDRRVLAIDAEPKPGVGADDAKKLVEQLAALAWMK